MKINLSLFILASRFVGVVAPTPGAPGYGPLSFSTSEQVVLEEGESMQSLEHKRFHNNRCEVRLQADGNFVVKRLIAPNPYYQTYRHAWTSGSHRGDGSGDIYYRAMLDSSDGSLIVVHEPPNQDPTVVYTSNVGDPEALQDYTLERTHKLVITEECVLQIYRDSQEAWTNNRFGGLSGEPGLSDYLQKGEMFHHKQCYRCGPTDDCIWVHQYLILQHDCNLVQFVGQDLADLEKHPTPLWSSGTPRPELKDCYLYSDEDKVRLYEGTLDKSLPQFAPRDGPFYWEADDDFMNPCYGGYEVLLKKEGGLEASC